MFWFRLPVSELKAETGQEAGAKHVGD